MGFVAPAVVRSWIPPKIIKRGNFSIKVNSHIFAGPKPIFATAPGSEYEFRTREGVVEALIDIWNTKGYSKESLGYIAIFNNTVNVSGTIHPQRRIGIFVIANPDPFPVQRRHQ